MNTIVINIIPLTILMKKINYFISLYFLLILAGCAFSPGMKEPSIYKSSWTYEAYEDDMTKVVEIDSGIIFSQEKDISSYRISKGDILSIVVFGQSDFFPITYSGINNPYTSKLVDEKGEIFFPYAGVIKAEGMTVSELRNSVTEKLRVNFNNPQVDVSISQFNSRRNIYILGEISRPKTIKVGLVPITLAEAISESDGLSQVTSNAERIFVIRKNKESEGGVVYYANLENASEFLVAGSFLLSSGDIIFVGASDITKWNRFVTQLFPFASFLNQIDNIQN
tara:strand:+ start:1806 stop:2648 length:843 start_codon:yes stop_codon:yes gene_type:complete